MNKFKLVGSVIKGCEHYYIAHHLNKNYQSILYIGRDDKEIFNIKEKINWLVPDIDLYIYRSWDQIPYDKVSPSKEIQAERIKTLYSLKKIKNKTIVLTSINALIQKTLNQDFLLKNFINIGIGQEIIFDVLIKQLLSLGYQRTSIVREKSDFSIRGSIIDIFVVERENPIRIDFFGNTIESIHEFDSFTQRRLQIIEDTNIIINPSCEVLLNKMTINNFKNKFRRIFPEFRRSEMYQSVGDGAFCLGLEQMMPLFHSSLCNLFDYCKGFSVILNNNFQDLVDSRIENINDFYSARIDSGDQFNLAPSNLYLTNKELCNLIENYKVYQLNDFHLPQNYNFSLKKIPNLSSIKKEIDFNFIQKFFDMNSQKKTIIICARSHGALERIRNILYDNTSISTVQINHFNEINNPNSIYITVLKIDEAAQLDNYIFINEKTLFGYNFSIQKKISKQKEVFFEEINKLSKNSILVHSEYGLCRFQDIQKLEINFSLHECMVLEFAEKQILYLPIENLNLITKYGDEEDKFIKLDKMGSVYWQRRKAEAKDRIKDIAKQLIKVAAKRLTIKSFPINFDQVTYDQFSSSFPYIETEDQLKACEDVKSDFLKDVPADRLIVGDVAAGKTELILRAIFLIAKSFLQAVVLVPTTILSRQHYNNFTQRLAPFGIRVGELSRFVSTKERNNTIFLLKEGQIDILIGTHAILNDKIVFKKLGLICLDEEQRFGTLQKEKLKKIWPQAHIISTTATPIPKTLSSSLSGIKDLSLILTLPFNRLSVRTYVTSFDQITISEAIRREVIGRKMGVFFVTPKIKDIPFLENYLKEYLPEISYVVVHGQLKSQILEERITKFYDKKVNLLLSTNIIESGLDLPHVNTIIVNRANMFSLSSLYQCKGRVGRGEKRGYAYLTYKEEDITENARKRLEIINSFDQLGSGFNIASADLNMRGPGSLISTEQSGFIKEVGTELCHSMLEEEIERLKDEVLNIKSLKKTFSFQPTIKIPEKIFIPDEFIADLDLRISIYKRIASITSQEEKEGLIVELLDRFGKFPKELQNLFKLIEIKLKCFENNIEKIEFGKNGILISYYKNMPKDPEKLLKKVLSSKVSNLKIRTDQKIFYDFEGVMNENRFTLVKKIIKIIS